MASDGNPPGSIRQLPPRAHGRAETAGGAREVHVSRGLRGKDCGGLQRSATEQISGSDFGRLPWEERRPTGVAQAPRLFSWLTNQNPGNRGNLRVIQSLWYKTSSTDENF